MLHASRIQRRKVVRARSVKIRMRTVIRVRSIRRAVITASRDKSWSKKKGRRLWSAPFAIISRYERTTIPATLDCREDSRRLQGPRRQWPIARLRLFAGDKGRRQHRQGAD